METLHVDGTRNQTNGLRAVAGAKARAICLFGGRTASRFAGTLGRMGPGLFGGRSWASAQYEAPVRSLLCRWADCNEHPFRGQERLTLVSAGDRACANRAFGLGSTRHSTRNCGPSGPGFGRLAQAGFGRSARRLTETVLEADSSSGPSEAVHSGITPLPDGSEVRRGHHKGSNSLASRTPRSGPQEPPRVESPSRLSGDVRRADTVAPRGIQVESMRNPCRAQSLAQVPSLWWPSGPHNRESSGHQLPDPRTGRKGGSPRRQR